jgi:flagellar motor switch/type III secretory pathway protein FliN
MNTLRSPLRRRLLAGMALAGLAAAAARASTAPVVVEGLAFERTLRLGGHELLLNGTGVRAVAWFKGYVAALYLPTRAATADEVATMPGPKRLQMRLLTDVPAGEFVKALNKGVARNVSPQQLETLQARLRRFDEQIAALDKVRKGDVVDLDHEPGRGLVMRVNGTLRGEALPGDDLYTALLRAFVGDRPYDERLKAGLLGRGA